MIKPVRSAQHAQIRDRKPVRPIDGPHPGASELRQTRRDPSTRLPKLANTVGRIVFAGNSPTTENINDTTPLTGEHGKPVRGNYMSDKEAFESIGDTEDPLKKNIEEGQKYGVSEDFDFRTMDFSQK